MATTPLAPHLLSGAVSPSGVSCVSLGPGSADLLTLRAARHLLSADIIYCPSTQRDGQVRSRARDLLTELGVSPERIQCFAVPMLRDRSHALRAYAATADLIAEAWRRGRTVAFVAEGDAAIYSSVHYIADRLQELQVPVVYLSGIPSFIAAAAISGHDLVRGQQPLLVLPALPSTEELCAEIERGRTVVVMKLPSHEEQLRVLLASHPEYSIEYFENIEVEGLQLHSTDPAFVGQRSYPYFSLMIIKRSRDEMSVPRPSAL